MPVSVSESCWKSDSLCCSARTGSIASFCSRGWLEIIPLYNQAQRPLPLLRAGAWRLAPWLQARLRSCRLKAGCVSPPGRSTHTVPATPHLPEEIWPESQTSWLLLYEPYPPPVLAGGFCFPLGCSDGIHCALRWRFKVPGSKWADDRVIGKILYLAMPSRLGAEPWARASERPLPHHLDTRPFPQSSSIRQEHLPRTILDVFSSNIVWF